MHHPALHRDRSLELLYALGALDAAGKLSKDIGVPLSRLPVDPMYGRVLLAAALKEECAVEALQLVAMVSAENVFINPRLTSLQLKQHFLFGLTRTQ